MIAVRRVPAPLAKEEAEALAALHRRAFEAPDGRGGRAWSAAEIAVLTDASGAILLAAGEAAAPLGLALFRVAADEAELLTIATEPRARRRGVAAALLSRAWPMLREAGAVLVFLEVGAANDAAISLYRTMGFREIARRANYYTFSDGGRDDALVYRLEVN